MAGLTLVRKVGEAIRIDGDVLITILEIKGKYARVAIEAPKSVRIDREETVEHPVPARRRLA